MTKRSKSRVSITPIVPATLRCPFCSAAPNRACKTSGGRRLRNVLGVRISLVHVARIELAVKMDLDADSQS